MKNAIYLGLSGVLLLGMPEWAYANDHGHQCFVDYVEPADGGVNIYMQPKIEGGGGELIVTQPKSDAPDDHYLFSYNSMGGAMIDGKWTPLTAPRFTYMAIGRKAYVDVEIHSGCEMTVEARGNQTVLRLVGGTSLPNGPHWHFDEIIVAVPYHPVPAPSGPQPLP